jgi:type II secretion system protein G
MNKSFSIKSGFTLIELMVVVAIIGILTAIVLGNIYSSRGRARDAKRISDISQIQLALEQYFDKCRQYPLTLTLVANNCTGVTATLGAYIAVLPTDPTTKANYDYKVDAAKLDYVLHTTLENTSGAISDGLAADPITPASLTCNPADKDYCIGPK